MEATSDWMSAAVLHESALSVCLSAHSKGFVFTKVTPTNAVSFAGLAGLSPLCDRSFKTLKTFGSGIYKKKKKTKDPWSIYVFFFLF